MVVAYEILVSAQGPLVLGFLGLGLRGLGPGLDNKNIIPICTYNVAWISHLIANNLFVQFCILFIIGADFANRSGP